MPTPTDLRAALRDIADRLDHLTHSKLIGEQSAKLRALADAPPTVAELLPMVDATHEVHWTDVDGDEWRAFAVGGGRPIWFAFRRKNRGDWYDGNPCDLTHEVHWTDVDGDEWRAFAVGGGRPIWFAFRRKNRGDWYDGNPCDLTAPATLVEVTP